MKRKCTEGRSKDRQPGRNTERLSKHPGIKLGKTEFKWNWTGREGESTGYCPAGFHSRTLMLSVSRRPLTLSSIRSL